MNVEIGADAALFPEKEYINVIAVAVCALAIRGTNILGISEKMGAANLNISLP